MMSFNVLTPNRSAADFDPSVPPEDVRLENRLPVMVRWIRDADPDVIGVQENEAFSAAALPVPLLAALLPGYTVVQAGVDVPLLVRADAYTVADAGALDISQGYYSRHLVWARLTSLDSGRPLLVANTHLDPYQRPEMARARVAELAAIVAALRRLNPSPPTPVVLLGDFNLRPDDSRRDTVAALGTLARAGLRDAAAIAAKDLTAVRGAASVNGLGAVVDGRWRYRAIRTDGFRYDYVMVSSGVTVRSWQVVTGPGVRNVDGHPTFGDGPLPSDHCPVQAELEFPA
jgi:endonuclease/exonuclease/phosphatase family metal-dependent hydrolase